MSRPWRIEYEGALYHLLSRGNERSDIFIDEKDRSSFLDAVGEMSQWFDIDIFAYVLMDNHKYASEEKRLFEDLRHGLILGSKQFVEKIRKKHAPAKTQLSIPQQR